MLRDLEEVIVNLHPLLPAVALASLAEDNADVDEVMAYHRDGGRDTLERTGSKRDGKVANQRTDGLSVAVSLGVPESGTDSGGDGQQVASLFSFLRGGSTTTEAGTSGNGPILEEKDGKRRGTERSKEVGSSHVQIQQRLPFHTDCAVQLETAVVFPLAPCVGLSEHVWAEAGSLCEAEIAAVNRAFATAESVSVDEMLLSPSYYQRTGLGSGMSTRGSAAGGRGHAYRSPADRSGVQTAANDATSVRFNHVIAAQRTLYDVYATFVRSDPVLLFEMCKWFVQSSDPELLMSVRSPYVVASLRAGGHMMLLKDYFSKTEAYADTAVLSVLIAASSSRGQGVDGNSMVDIHGNSVDETLDGRSEHPGRTGISAIGGTSEGSGRNNFASIEERLELLEEALRSIALAEEVTTRSGRARTPFPHVNGAVETRNDVLRLSPEGPGIRELMACDLIRLGVEALRCSPDTSIATDAAELLDIIQKIREESQPGHDVWGEGHDFGDVHGASQFGQQGATVQGGVRMARDSEVSGVWTNSDASDARLAAYASRCLQLFGSVFSALVQTLLVWAKIQARMVTDFEAALADETDESAVGESRKARLVDFLNRLKSELLPLVVIEEGARRCRVWASLLEVYSVAPTYTAVLGNVRGIDVQSGRPGGALGGCGAVSGVSLHGYGHAGLIRQLWEMLLIERCQTMDIKIRPAVRISRLLLYGRRFMRGQAPGDADDRVCASSFPAATIIEILESDGLKDGDNAYPEDLLLRWLNVCASTEAMGGLDVVASAACRHS